MVYQVLINENPRQSTLNQNAGHNVQIFSGDFLTYGQIVHFTKSRVKVSEKVFRSYSKNQFYH